MFYLALGFSKEDPRDARYSSRYYRIGPPPIVGPLLTGLSCFCLPNVLSQQRLRVVDAKVYWGAAPGEGCKQWLHCRGGEEILVTRSIPSQLWGAVSALAVPRSVRTAGSIM